MLRKKNDMSDFNFSENPIFKFFYDINQIPRGSNNEDAIAEKLENMGKELGFITKTDAAGNVMIVRHASDAMKNAPKIILQGHMDMVCEKDKDSNHDFFNDPIDMYEDSGWIRARGTTLGADDGIGVAMGLALITEDIDMPEIHLLITRTEETGMDGAKSINPDFLDADLLINIDSEEEGYLTAGCAGGTTANLSIPLEHEKELPDEDKLSLVIEGMRGGHSGMEIKQVSTNAMKTMAEWIKKISEEVDVHLYDLKSGSKHNAIPNTAEAVIGFPNVVREKVLRVVEKIKSEIVEKMIKKEPDIVLSVKGVEANNFPLTIKALSHLTNCIQLLPHGIYSMNSDQINVQTSNNLAIVRIEEDKASFVISVRSSNAEKMEELKDKIKSIIDIYHGEYDFPKGYPAWEYREESKLRDLFNKNYKEITGKDLNIIIIHAGLECGLFAKKNPNLDMISFGPDIHGAHTTKECLSVESTKRSYELLKKVILDLAR